YNAGECYWDRDNTARQADGLIWQDKYNTQVYSNRVLENCASEFGRELCENCIKRDICPDPEPPVIA
ncbi:hypothetical protein D6764_02880, partial [Candidatus Woesearchaeota archaeon]